MKAYHFAYNTKELDKLESMMLLVTFSLRARRV